MTNAILEGKWNQMKGEVREQWGKLTDDDISAVRGKSEQLIGKLQEKYGYTKQKAEQEVADFMKRFSDNDSAASGSV